MNTTKFDNSKLKTPRDSAYLKWIRTQPCVACGYPPPNEAHHAYSNGMGIKGSDFDTVPLCHIHHSKVHLEGRKDGIQNLKAIIERLMQKYLNS